MTINTIGEVNREINRLSEDRAACWRRLGAGCHDIWGTGSTGREALLRQIAELGTRIDALYAEKRRLIARAQSPWQQRATLRAPDRDWKRQLLLLRERRQRTLQRLYDARNQHPLRRIV